MNDYDRVGVFVNGRFHKQKETGTTEQGFIALFPDAYTAEKLSNLATQSLPAMFSSDAVMTAKPQTSGQMIFEQIMCDMAMLAEPDGRQNYRIDALNAEQGLYRISCSISFISSDPESGIERYMYDVAVDVDLGAPVVGEGRRSEPKVTNARLDLLVRGRETVPGEQ
jgi:hypothetical protein